MTTVFRRLENFCRKCKQQVEYGYFLAAGRKPWTRGYEIYKWKNIAEALSPGFFERNLGKERFGYRVDERIVEYPWLLSRLPETPGLLLDAGSALNHAVLLDQSKLASKKVIIATLAPEGQAFWQKGVSYLYEDVRQTHLQHGIFDWIVCLSTLEHVGLDNTFLYTDDAAKKEMQPETTAQFLSVLRNLLKPGGTLFLSFPYGKKKNHGWFQVFDASDIAMIIDTFSPSTCIETIYQYEEECWRLSSREKAKDATCFDPHKQKTYDADFAAFSRSAACLELVR